MEQYLSWGAIEAILCGAYRALLYGPPGTGKTKAAFNTADALDRTLYNVTLSDETPAAELRGHFVPKGGDFVWMDGPAVRAWKEGAVLCLDEIDKASQDCLDFLHGLLADREMARLTLPTGKILESPAEGFKVIATMNGDIMELQPSLQDRFAVAIAVSQPHPDAIASLPDDLQGAASNFETYDAQQRPSTVRRWAAFNEIRHLDGVTVEDAARAVFAHRSTELMDAIGFRPEEEVEELEVDLEEPGTGHPSAGCPCSECMFERAAERLRVNGVEVQYDYDEDPLCPTCGTYKSNSSLGKDEAYKLAVLCCWDDGAKDFVHSEDQEF